MSSYILYLDLVIAAISPHKLSHSLSLSAYLMGKEPFENESQTSSSFTKIRNFNNV